MVLGGCLAVASERLLLGLSEWHGRREPRTGVEELLSSISLLLTTALVASGCVGYEDL